MDEALTTVSKREKDHDEEEYVTELKQKWTQQKLEAKQWRQRYYETKELYDQHVHETTTEKQELKDIKRQHERLQASFLAEQRQRSACYDSLTLDHEQSKSLLQALQKRHMVLQQEHRQLQDTYVNLQEELQKARNAIRLPPPSKSVETMTEPMQLPILSIEPPAPEEKKEEEEEVKHAPPPSRKKGVRGPAQSIAEQLRAATVSPMRRMSLALPPGARPLASRRASVASIPSRLDDAHSRPHVVIPLSSKEDIHTPIPSPKESRGPMKIIVTSPSNSVTIPASVSVPMITPPMI